MISEIEIPYWSLDEDDEEEPDIDDDSYDEFPHEQDGYYFTDNPPF